MINSRLLGFACTCLTLAVGCGVAESAVAMITFGLDGSLPPHWPLQVGVRVIVYGVVFVLIMLTRRGSRVARWALLILLGVFGTASLVVPMITELAAGQTLLVALGADTSPLFPLFRGLHIVLVVVGSIALLATRPPRVSAERRARPATLSRGMSGRAG